jgi:ABC-type phosphate/phosphonate transport system substrate-binding protein
MKKIKVTIFLLGIVLFEFLIFAYAFWPPKPQPAWTTMQPLRMGVVRGEERQPSEKEWKALLEFLRTKLQFPVEMYYANSHEEAITGFLYGSLDIIYMNPVGYLKLKRRCQGMEKNCVPKMLFYHKLNAKELTQNRSYLFLKGKENYLSETKGKRLTLINPGSMAGYAVPKRYLELKLKMPLNKWFSKVDVKPQAKNALNYLKAGKTDLVAGGRTLLHFIAPLKTKMLWSSMKLPENLLCINQKSPIFNNKSNKKLPYRLKKLRQFLQIQKNLDKKDQNIHLIIQAPDYSYQKRLEKLETFLYSKEDRMLVPGFEDILESIGRGQ